MAHQWNDSIPAIGNQVANDIPDIEENFGHIRDSLERVFETWATTNGGNASAKFNTAVGFYDGTYNYEFPTNGVGADSVFMLGTSDTIIWMYLNTAPPGWKALSTGADTVLAVSGGTGDYNVNGGNADSSATWTIDGFTTTTENDSHNHQWYNYTNTSTNAQTYASNGSATNITTDTRVGNNHISAGAENNILANDSYTTSDTHNHTASTSQDGSWRPKASVGKLFQLDTA